MLRGKSIRIENSINGKLLLLSGLNFPLYVHNLSPRGEIGPPMDTCCSSPPKLKCTFYEFWSFSKKSNNFLMFSGCRFGEKGSVFQPKST